MNNNGNSFRVVCLACGETINIKKPIKLWQIVECRYCREQFEIVELDPLFLDWPIYSDDYDDYMEEVYFEDEPF